MPAQIKLFNKQRLLTPGPTSVPEEVLLEMAQPIIHHRTKAFQAFYKELCEQLQRLYKTTGPVMSIAGSGTTAFEAAQISLARPGSKVISIASGKFGERWQDIYDQYAKSLDITNIKINVPWGSAPTADTVSQALKENPGVSAIALCHSETATSSACDIKAIAAAVRAFGDEPLLLVDGITSVGAMPVEMDAWGIDCLVTGSQKAMMLPPGLGYVGLGARALKRMEEVKAGGFYNLDLRRWYKAWQANDVPFTPPVSLIRGQRVALKMLEAEGYDSVYGRVATLAHATRETFKAMNLKLISTSPSDSSTGAFYPVLPTPIDAKKFRAAVRDNFGIHLADGQDGRGAKWAATSFRISHMGNVDAGDTLACLHAVEAELIKHGHNIPKGTALKEAAKHL